MRCRQRGKQVGQPTTAESSNGFRSPSDVSKRKNDGTPPDVVKPAPKKPIQPSLADEPLAADVSGSAARNSERQLKKQLIDMQGKLDMAAEQATMDINKVKKDLQKSKDSCEAMRRREGNHKQGKDKAVKDLQALRKEVKPAETKIKTLTKDKESLNKEVKDLHKTSGHLQNEKEELQHDKEELELQVKTLTLKLKKNEGPWKLKITALEVQLQEAEEKIPILEESHSDALAKNIELNARIKDMDIQLAAQNKYIQRSSIKYGIGTPSPSSHHGDHHSPEAFMPQTNYMHQPPQRDPLSSLYQQSISQSMASMQPSITHAVQSPTPATQFHGCNVFAHSAAQLHPSPGAGGIFQMQSMPQAQPTQYGAPTQPSQYGAPSSVYGAPSAQAQQAQAMQVPQPAQAMPPQPAQAMPITPEQFAQFQKFQAMNPMHAAMQFPAR